MTTVSIRDLRLNSSAVWERLREDGEMVLTSNGKPIAVMSSVDDLSAEEAVAAFRLVVDDRTLLELSEVLARVSFGLAPGDVREFVGFVARTSLHLSPRPLLALPDPDDAPFIELAAEAGVPLVTGNSRHFREVADQLAITLLSPREAVELMAGV